MFVCDKIYNMSSEKPSQPKPSVLNDLPAPIRELFEEFFSKYPEFNPLHKTPGEVQVIHQKIDDTAAFLKGLVDRMGANTEQPTDEEGQLDYHNNPSTNPEE